MLQSLLSHFNGWIDFGTRIFHYFLENFEDGQLEEHSGRFTIPSDAMEHFDDAMIRQCRVG